MVLNALITALALAALGVHSFNWYRIHTNATRSIGQTVRSAQRGASVDIRNLPIKGSPKARVVLIEFSDYTCPYCRRHATEVAPRIDEEFVATGHIRRIFATNPLPHNTNGHFLAIAAHCAGEQDRFWQMSESLFRVSVASRSEVLKLGEKTVPDMNTFETCVAEKSRQSAAPIERVAATAKELLLTSTPSFAIGYIKEQPRAELTKYIVGAQRYEVFRQALHDALKQH